MFQKYRETTKLAGGWVDSISPLYHPDADRKEFLVLAPVLDGSHGHFRHIMRVQVWNGRDLKYTGDRLVPVTHVLTITLPSPKSHCNVRCAYIKMRGVVFHTVHV